MKKSISAILCMCIVLCSFFSVGSVAFAAEASTAGNLLSVTNSGVYNDTITYTVNLKGGVNVAGAVVKAVYDPNVLEVVSAGQAQGSPISGYYMPGAQYDRNDMYSIGYMNNSDYKNGASDTAFMQFTFKVKGDARPYTEVSFYCDQFSCDSQANNNISGGDYEAFYTWGGTTLSTTHVLSATMFEGGVTVEWEPTIGAVGYVVYKVVNGGWTEIARTTECSYIDYQVANNNNYQYTVRAYNENGLNSSFEQGVTVCYLLAPSLLWLSPGGSSVMASWPAMEGISTYRLYRRAVYTEGDKGEWVLVGSTNTTSLVDRTNTVLNWNNYEYAICSVSGNNESPKYTISQVRTSTVPNVTLGLGSDGVWYCYTNGVVNSDYRGLVSYSNGWYYVRNGVVDWGYTGLVEYSGQHYYVVNGSIDWGVTALIYFDDTWYYVENGQVNTNAKTLCNYAGGWYFVENGRINWDYTGLVEYYGTWYYVVNGFLDWNVTTLTNFNNVWYYVENGQINWNSNTLCQYSGNWYYVQNGAVNWDYTGLVEYYGTWYYVVNGFLDWNVTTLTNFNNVWYYVENGQINWNSNTLCQYGGNWYYAQNGAVNWDYTGFVEYYGTLYYVVNGFLDWNVTTLISYNDEWYYVEGGTVSSTVNKIVEYGGRLFYVKNSKIDWSYSTIATYGDKTYYVCNGEVASWFSGDAFVDGQTYRVENGVVTGTDFQINTTVDFDINPVY